MDARLELQRVFLRDAADLLAARERSKILHGTHDIRASGNEVEVAARHVLARRLPSNFSCGHGHIVDRTWATSAQHDIIISDALKAPMLFRGEDGTEYHPYESVYAIGEVKSTYRKPDDPIGSFCSSLDKIRSSLSREDTHGADLLPGVRFGAGLSVDSGQLPLNPLFTFMVFVSGDGFDISDLAKLYSDRRPGDLPCVVCILDKGVIVNSQFDRSSSTLGAIRMMPGRAKEAGIWSLVPVGDSDYRLGSNLAFLYALLMAHLSTCLLSRPNMLAYLEQLLTHSSGTPIAESHAG